MSYKLSNPNQHYWGSEGLYQSEYDKLVDKLMPSQGEAETHHGELLRSITRLYHEYCNNGNINACNVIYVEQWVSSSSDGYDDYNGDDDYDFHEDDGYYEEVEDSFEISDLYQRFIDYIRYTFSNNEDVCGLLNQIENSIINDTLTFNDDDMNVYDHVVDHIVMYCLSTENSPRLEY